MSDFVITQINDFLDCCDNQRQYISKLSSFFKRDSVLDYQDISNLVSYLMKFNDEISWFKEQDNSSFQVLKK